jgi:hypothetical protein
METAARRDSDGRAARGGRGSTAAVRAARLRTAARSGRRRDGRGGLSGGGRSERGGRARCDAVGRRTARAIDSGFKPRRRRGAWQPRGNGALPHGPGTAHEV